MDHPVFGVSALVFLRQIKKVACHGAVMSKSVTLDQLLIVKNLIVFIGVNTVQ